MPILIRALTEPPAGRCVLVYDWCLQAGAAVVLPNKHPAARTNERLPCLKQAHSIVFEKSDVYDG